MSSNKEKDSTGGVGNEAHKLPPVGQAVWVQCGTYRTLAYRDEKGTWRSVAKKEEIHGVTKVLWE